MLAELGRVARIGIEGQAVLAEHRRLLGQAMRLLVFVGQRARLVLARLDIRLIERVDADDRAGHGGGDLPAEEFLADMPDILDADARDRMAGLLQRLHRLALRRIDLPVQLQIGEESVVAVAIRRGERLAGERDQSTALLAGTFRQKLLQPGAEIGDYGRGDDRHLVASEARCSDTHGDAELHARIFRTAGHRGRRTVALAASSQQAFDVQADRSGWDQAELRQHGVTSANRGHAMKDAGELQLRARRSSGEPGSVTATKCAPACPFLTTARTRSRK